MTLIYSSCLLYWGQSFTGQSPSSASDSDSATERPHQQPGHGSAPSSAAALHPTQQLLLDPHGLSWQAFLARTRGGGTLVSEGQLISPTSKHGITTLGFPKWTNELSCWFTFFSILEPFNKLLHLLQKNTLSFCKMSIFIPLEDGFFTQNFSCKMGKSSINTANCWEPAWQPLLPLLEASCTLPLGTAR